MSDTGLPVRAEILSAADLGRILRTRAGLILGPGSIFGSPSWASLLSGCQTSLGRIGVTRNWKCVTLDSPTARKSCSSERR